MSIGSVFSNMVRSDAFKGTLAAIGVAAAGEIGARLGNIATERGYEPSAAAQTGAAAPAAGTFAGFGFGTIPWGSVFVVGVVAVGGYALAKALKKRR